MNIYVCLKQVPDTEASILIKDGKSVNEANIKWIVNPYDEYAIEEALKLKEKIPGAAVSAVTLGPARADAVLRTALAMGVDRAVHILAEEYLDFANTAKALANLIRQDSQFGVIFTGKQAIDDDAVQVPLLLAEALAIPAATQVLTFAYADGLVRVEREIDEGAREKIEMKVPCLVAAAKGLNTPRYASVMGIMKAKKIEVRKVSPADLDVRAADNRLQVLKLSVPPEKPQGKIVPGDATQAAGELIRLLKEEAKVL